MDWFSETSRLRARVQRLLLLVLPKWSNRLGGSWRTPSQEHRSWTSQILDLILLRQHGIMTLVRGLTYSFHIVVWLALALPRLLVLMDAQDGPTSRGMFFGIARRFLCPKSGKNLLRFGWNLMARFEIRLSGSMENGALTIQYTTENLSPTKTTHSLIPMFVTFNFFIISNEKVHIHAPQVPHHRLDLT